MEGRTMAMIFEKPSLRTRVSFEAGMFQLGGHAIYLGPEDIGLGRRESVEDIARVLSRQVDLITARVFEHENVEALAEYAHVPVINALSNFTHPCQVLADLQTMEERGKTLRGSKLAYFGDGNNVANSLTYGGVLMGMHVFAASPADYQLKGEVMDWARQVGPLTGGSLTVSENLVEAATGADVLYTDVWASMGQEAEAETRRVRLADYRIDSAVLQRARRDAVVLHCLPAHYGEEISKEVAESPNSAIFDQAENRLHAQKALILLLTGNARS
jgi:ornithine carbamoyltransferase